jgi:cysteine synthase A|tara:strand:+ start:5062 stop:6063 length:1002 start_codon:yes stop_codon:yes gene_type:complete
MSEFSLASTIGNTPLIKLQQVSELTGCNIYGKAEFMNPGGSVKDRTALGIIEAAEANGSLKPGGTIVEGTAGNTGIGLTLLASAKGYKCVVLMPDVMSQEKQDLLELYGADLRVVPATSIDDPKHYIHRAEKLAAKMNQKEPNSALWAQQFDNLANMDIHYTTTGQEIWQQTNGEVDGFICASGTGGTLAGVSKALKEHNQDITIGLADPMGSGMYSYLTTGTADPQGSSIAEGIGISFVTENFKQARIDKAFQIEDRDALPYIFDLIRNEGLCLGGSAAINIAGAVQLAKALGPGHTIVTILCDNGSRYQSKLYNPVFLRQRNLPTPDWVTG